MRSITSKQNPVMRFKRGKVTTNALKDLRQNGRVVNIFIIQDDLSLRPASRTEVEHNWSDIPVREMPSKRYRYSKNNQIKEKGKKPLQTRGKQT